MLTTTDNQSVTGEPVMTQQDANNPIKQGEAGGRR
jgi:hypothetical protein